MVANPVRAHVTRHKYRCCASRGTSEGAIEKPIHCLDHRPPIVLLAFDQKPTPDKGSNLGSPQFQSVTPHSLPLPPSAPAHPLCRSGASGLDVFGDRGW